MRTGVRFGLALVGCLWVGTLLLDRGVAYAEGILVEVRGRLRSKDAVQRRSAMEKLAEHTFSKMRLPDEAQRLAAARSILDPLRSELVEATRDTDDGVRALSAKLLAWVTPEPAVADALVALLEHPVWDIRAIALQGLMVVGADSARARRAVVAMLQPTNEAQFTAAAAVVAHWRAAEALPALKSGLRSDDLEVKRASAKALGSFGTSGRDSLTALKAALGAIRHKERRIRDTANEIEAAIGQIEKSEGDSGRGKGTPQPAHHE